jgi:hypothetical protein
MASSFKGNSIEIQSDAFLKTTSEYIMFITAIANMPK